MYDQVLSRLLHSHEYTNLEFCLQTGFFSLKFQFIRKLLRGYSFYTSTVNQIFTRKAKGSFCGNLFFVNHEKLLSSLNVRREFVCISERIMLSSFRIFPYLVFFVFISFISAILLLSADAPATFFKVGSSLKHFCLYGVL